MQDYSRQPHQGALVAQNAYVMNKDEAIELVAFHCDAIMVNTTVHPRGL